MCTFFLVKPPIDVVPFTILLSPYAGGGDIITTLS
ncbi:uncharacterized protein METZ01_LOCUS461937, partial [marine metagenome]